MVTRPMAVGALVVLALGCANFDTPVDPSGGAPDVLVPTPSFSANVAPIFEKRVSFAGHPPGGTDVGPDSGVRRDRRCAVGTTTS